MLRDFPKTQSKNLWKMLEFSEVFLNKKTLNSKPVQLSMLQSFIKPSDFVKNFFPETFKSFPCKLKKFLGKLF